MRAAALRDVHPLCGVSDARSEQSSGARASGGVSSVVGSACRANASFTPRTRRLAGVSLECPMTREQVGAERHYG
jgi:hypothetical protein